MKNKYILLRHGQTKYQAEKIDEVYPKEEVYKLPITEYGKEQIKKSAQELNSLGINLIFCSTYHRTRQSAKIVSEELNITPIFDERLIDTGNGIFSGRPMKEVIDFFKDKKDRFSAKAPEGESWNDVIKRTSSLIKEIEKKYQDQIILIISHADPIWLLAGYLRGLTEEEMISQRNPQGIWPETGQYIIV